MLTEGPTEHLPLNYRLLSVISSHAIVIVTEVLAFHISQEILVVSDDDELEVGLLLSNFDDVVKGLGQGPNVIAIQIRRGLVERNKL